METGEKLSRVMLGAVRSQGAGLTPGATCVLAPLQAQGPLHFVASRVEICFKL